MKFAFFGTPDVARDTLEILHQSGYTPALVVTNPDAPRGRGQLLTPSITKVWAEERGIPVLTPEKLDEAAIEKIGNFETTLAIVVAYGKILPEKLINSFPLGVINVHYSLLPKYRGASPVETALLNGDTKTGVTLQRMVKELDAGDVIASADADILPDDTVVTLRERLIRQGAELLIASLPAYLSGEITLTPQDQASATFAKKFKKEDGLISLSDSSTINWNKFRAFAGSIGTYFFADDKRIKITKAHLTSDGEFIIDRVIPEGRKEIDYSQFLNK